MTSTVSLAHSVPPASAAPAKSCCQALRNFVQRIWNAIASVFKGIIDFILCRRATQAPAITPTPPPPVATPVHTAVASAVTPTPPAPAPAPTLPPVAPQPPRDPLAAVRAAEQLAALGPVLEQKMAAADRRAQEESQKLIAQLRKNFRMPPETPPRPPGPESLLSPPRAPAPIGRSPGRLVLQSTRRSFSELPGMDQHGDDYKGDQEVAPASTLTLPARGKKQGLFLVAPFPEDYDPKKEAIFMAMTGLVCCWRNLKQNEPINPNFLSAIIQTGIEFRDKWAEQKTNESPIPFSSDNPNDWTLRSIIQDSLTDYQLAISPFSQQIMNKYQLEKSNEGDFSIGQAAKMLGALTEINQEYKVSTGAILIEGELNNNPEIYVVIRTQEKVFVLDVNTKKMNWLIRDSELPRTIAKKTCLAIPFTAAG